MGDIYSLLGFAGFTLAGLGLIWLLERA